MDFRMLCSKPYFDRNNKILVPCGGCCWCRAKKSRLWANRILLEASHYGVDNCCFVTLTYNDSNLPINEHGRAVVSRRDITLFLKRLRKALPVQIRYFCGAEYGSKGMRPHYHLAIFGINETYAEIVDSAWQKGYTYTLPFKKGADTYISQYVVKTEYRNRQWYYDRGLEPEFQRCSLALGIKHIYNEVVDTVKQYNMPDVPPYYTVGERKMYFNSYYKNKLRSECFERYYVADLREKYLSVACEIQHSLIYDVIRCATDVERAIRKKYVELRGSYIKAFKKKAMRFVINRRNKHEEKT